MRNGCLLEIREARLAGGSWPVNATDGTSVNGPIREHRNLTDSEVRAEPFDERTAVSVWWLLSSTEYPVPGTQNKK